MEIKSKKGIGRWLNAGLIGAVIVDGILNFPMFVSISITPLITFAFIGIALLAVLFKVFALDQGWRVTWALLAALTFYGSTSMAVQETGKQTAIATSSDSQEEIADSEYLRLVKESAELFSSWQGLQKQFDEATRPETMERLQLQIDAARDLYKDKDQERKDRLVIVEQRLTESNKEITSADDVLYAIPNAIRDGRVIPVIFFTVAFFSLEAFIYAVVRARKKEKNGNGLLQEQSVPVILSNQEERIDVKEEETSEESEDAFLPDEELAKQPELETIQDKIRPKSFIYYSWPKGKNLINKPELIAKQLGVSKEEAIAFHKAFYNVEKLKLEGFAKYFRPNMKRDEFLKLRREHV